MAELDGKDFVARARLSDRADNTIAEVGDTCERVQASSLPWLLAGGYIAPAPPAPAPARLKTRATAPAFSIQPAEAPSAPSADAPAEPGD